MKEPEFTLGIEEEYYLVDRDSRDLANDPPEALMDKCKSMLQGQVSPEFLKSQIEIGTNVCHSLGEARQELKRLRGSVALVAQKFNCAPIAVSTHPFGDWTAQTHTDRERYHTLAGDMKIVARRLLICGMHVHIGIEDKDLRMDIFNQIAYFLPHLLALSTSSPFWHGELSGLKSYRLSVFDELPRTGMPPQFSNFNEYQRTIDVLIRAGTIEDATKVWWDLRPSARFPTLEMRISDVCTRLEDTLCIAALFRCLCRMLYRLRVQNQSWRQYPLFLLRENRWRAQRYGIEQGLIDFGLGKIIPYENLMDELIELIWPDADFFNCTEEVLQAREILKHGTSADRQIDLFQRCQQEGKSNEQTMQEIVDMLIADTMSQV